MYLYEEMKVKFSISITSHYAILFLCSQIPKIYPIAMPILYIIINYTTLSQVGGGLLSFSFKFCKQGATNISPDITNNAVLVATMIHSKTTAREMI